MPDPASFFPLWYKMNCPGIVSAHKNIFEFDQQNVTMLYINTSLSDHVYHQQKIQSPKRKRLLCAYSIEYYLTEIVGVGRHLDYFSP